MTKRMPPKKGTMKRILKSLFSAYPIMLPVTIVFIIINAVVSSIPSIFMQKVIEIVEANYKTAEWSDISKSILSVVLVLVLLYLLSLASNIIYHQLF